MEVRPMKVLAFPLALALAALVACDEIGAPAGEVGGPAPDYGAMTLAGDSVRLSDLAGSVVLLNVWATWCPPCIEEMPDLQEIYQRNAHRGLEVVGVSIDGRGETENVRRFANDLNVTFTIWHDPDDAVGSRFRTRGVPTSVLIDREGTVVWRHMGPITADDPGLHSALESALTPAG
jgi:thiol-disulfide isomerase/thioredoxin